MDEWFVDVNVQICILLFIFSNCWFFLCIGCLNLGTVACSDCIRSGFIFSICTSANLKGSVSFRWCAFGQLFQVFPPSHRVSSPRSETKRRLLLGPNYLGARSNTYDLYNLPAVVASRVQNFNPSDSTGVPVTAPCAQSPTSLLIETPPIDPPTFYSLTPAIIVSLYPTALVKR